MGDLSEITVECAGRQLSLSARTRLNKQDLIVFAHGFGCAKEAYDGAFTAPDLRGFALCAFDFPSHGASDQLVADDSTLENYAAVLRGVIHQLPHRRLFLVCHSMGGAAGLIAIQGVARLGCFISVEGNLIAEDCGLVSRGTAEQEQREFVENGYDLLVEGLRNSTRPDQLTWSTWLSRCQPASLHAIARSLVSWSDRDALSPIFRGLRQRHYVHGSQSDLNHIWPTLRDTPVHAIAGSDHFPMLDNPERFYAVVGEILSGATGNASAAGRPKRPQVIAGRRS